MSTELTQLIDTYARRLEVPIEYTITESAKQQYYLAIDKANEYRGEPTVLLEALTLFQQTGNVPLFYAGVAYTHIQAAYIQGFDYAEAGLQRARIWLERAAQLIPQIIELLLVETFIALRGKQSAEAKQHIARLRERDPQNFYVLLAQVEFHGMMMEISCALPLFEQALTAATSPTQEIYLRNRIARYYSLFGKTTQAAEMYQVLTQLTPDDPWIWHNLSIIYLQRYRLGKAWQCNSRALGLMNFDNARQVRRRIIRQYAIMVLGGIVIAFIGIVYLMNAIMS